MNGDGSGEQPAAPRLARQQDRPRRERRLEWVAPGRKRVERRRGATEHCGPGSGSNGGRHSHSARIGLLDARPHT